MTPIIVTETREIDSRVTTTQMEQFWLALCDSACSRAVLKAPFSAMERLRVTVTVEVLE